MSVPDDSSRRLFDPDVALPDDAVLIADRGGGAAGVIGWGVAAVVIGALAVSGAVSAAGARGEMSGDFWLEAALAAIAAIAAVVLVRKAMAAARARREIAAGRWRYGLFVLPDALVLRTPRDHMQWAREDIAKITLRQSTAPDRATTMVKELAITYFEPDRALREHVLRGGFAETLDQLAMRLDHWHRG